MPCSTCVAWRRVTASRSNWRNLRGCTCLKCTNLLITHATLSVQLRQLHPLLIAHATLSVQFLLWQAAKPSGDNCPPNGLLTVLQSVDCSDRVCSLEYVAAAHEHIGTSLYEHRSRLVVYATVNLYESLAARLVDEAAPECAG